MWAVQYTLICPVADIERLSFARHKLPTALRRLVPLCFPKRRQNVKILVIDVGGSNVKILATGQAERRSMISGPELTAEAMVAGVKTLADGWTYDAVAIGYPGMVAADQPAKEPHNLAPGWVAFDYPAAFGCPVRIINDAAMQALGSFDKGKLLFLGLGTGLGSAMVINGLVVQMELAHLPYRKGTFEDYVGDAALNRHGKKTWCKRVADVVARLTAALVPDEVVLGGGNVRHLNELPPLCRLGDNANAFIGGFRLWEDPTNRPTIKRNPTVN
jgi:polyphosphate glucokinase